MSKVLEVQFSVCPVCRDQRKVSLEELVQVSEMESLRLKPNNERLAPNTQVALQGKDQD